MAAAALLRDTLEGMGEKIYVHAQTTRALSPLVPNDTKHIWIKSTGTVTDTITLPANPLHREIYLTVVKTDAAHAFFLAYNPASNILNAGATDFEADNPFGMAAVAAAVGAATYRFILTNFIVNSSCDVDGNPKVYLTLRTMAAALLNVYHDTMGASQTLTAALLTAHITPVGDNVKYINATTGTAADTFITPAAPQHKDVYLKVLKSHNDHILTLTGASVNHQFINMDGTFLGNGPLVLLDAGAGGGEIFHFILSFYVTDGIITGGHRNMIIRAVQI